MGRAKQRRILEIIASDRTFSREAVRGLSAWVGKCLHCNGRLVVAASGEPVSRATIEHVVPKAHGGGDELENLALACARCNHEKGIRHDRRGPADPRAREVIESLAAKRRKRWREPAPDPPEPGGPSGR